MSDAAVRVVFVTTVFEGVHTGPGIYARHLWRAFRDDPEIEFHVVAPEIRERHPRLHVAGGGFGSLDLYRRVQTMARDVAAAKAGCAILHGNSTHGMGLLADHCGPLVVQVNDYETAMFPASSLRILRESGLRRLLSSAWRHREEARVLRRASLALCNSDFTRSQVERRYRLDPGRLRVLYKAVDTARFDRPAALPADPLPLRPPGARLVFVGSVWKTKGLDTLLLALPAVADCYPSTSLVVIGSDSADPELLRLIGELGLEDRVHLGGTMDRDELATHLWHADVFVLPSRREGFGVAVIEAMAAGVPVVATAVGGIPELVRPGVEGLLVPASQPVALANAIRVLLREPARCRAMAAAGVQRATAFSVDRMIAAVRRTYLELAASG